MDNPSMATEVHTARESFDWRKALSFKKVSAIYIWAGLILIFAVWVPETFLTSTTVVALAGEQAVTTMVALGLVVALATGLFDLSVGAVLGSSAVLCAWLTVEHGWNPALAVAVTLCFGLLVGVINSIVVVRFKVDSFIATLGMSSVLVALQEWMTENQQIIGLSAGFKKIATLKPLGLPIAFFYMLVLAVILWYVLQLTPLGRYLYATGGSREIARLAGVRPERWMSLSLVVSSLVASFAGIVVLARISGAGPTLGGSYLLPVFAASFLGATQFVPGRFNVWGTVVSVFVLATGTKGLQLAGLEPWVDKLFYGTVLVIAVILAGPSGSVRRRIGRREKPSSPAADASDPLVPEGEPRG